MTGSLVVGTRATPTSRARPSADRRWPTPWRSTPSEDSVVSVVCTISGCAVYSGPAVNSKEACLCGGEQGQAQRMS